MTGIVARIGSAAKTVRYTVTNHQVELIAHLAESDDDRPPVAGRGFVRAVWADLEACAALPFGTPGRRLLAWLLESRRDALLTTRRD